MRPNDLELHNNIQAAIDRHATALEMPGIARQESRIAFVEQLLESEHRVRYFRVIATRHISEERTDPHSDKYDPIKAAILLNQRGDYEEACWQAFIAVHFGKNLRAGWRYAKEVIGRRGAFPTWTWPQINSDLNSFLNWLDNNQEALRPAGVPLGFGNHRKYTSLDAYKPAGTGAAIRSYLHWVNSHGSHMQLFNNAIDDANGNAHIAFERLFAAMNVKSFGRTAKFDYLTLIGKTQIADIQPGTAHLVGATGPLKGAKLLYTGNPDGALNARQLDQRLVEFGQELGIPFAMQILEDSLCNWQKSPNQFVPFRG